MTAAVVGFVFVYAVVLWRWWTWGYFGWDATHYFDAARRFVDTGTPYLPSEVAGPFEYQDLTFLHPPVSLYLFVPFAYLPRILWWAIPIAGTAALIVSMRPARWSWPLVIGLLVWWQAPLAVSFGNSDMWVLFFVAAGLRFGWPALAIVVKPSLGLFALVGARRRSWWLGLPVVALACLPFGSLWLDWFHVIQNSPGSLWYSLPSMVSMLAPVVAWTARQ